MCFMQNMLFETKCVLWPKCGFLKQNVFYAKCAILNKMCLWNVLCEFLCGKYCITIYGLLVNAWCNFWMHSRVIVMHAGVHAMMTLKYLRMRHAYDSDMQTNICNAICMVLCAWRCNDVFLTVFHLGDGEADSTCWVYLLLDL